MKKIVGLLLMFSPVLHADETFPGPVGWEANLQNVKISLVTPEFTPPSPLEKEVEAKITARLKERGLLYKKGEGDFSVLTPSVHCQPPYGGSQPTSLCQIALTLREHVLLEALPKRRAGKRLPSGIVGTYHSSFPNTFAPENAVILKAVDRLMDHFLAAVSSPK